MLSTLEVPLHGMDHRFRKVEVRIKGIFAPILNLNLRQVEEMK
jgi:hypothetical protein